MAGFELVVIDDRDSALVEVVVNSEAFVLPTHHRGDYIITVQELVIHLTLAPTRCQKLNLFVCLL